MYTIYEVEGLFVIFDVTAKRVVAVCFTEDDAKRVVTALTFCDEGDEQ